MRGERPDRRASPVEKELGEIPGDAPLGDRKNMVFSGSFVTYGRAKFLVTGTGMNTEMGKIAALLKSTEEKKKPFAGESGSIRPEAVHWYFDHLRSAVCRQRIFAP